MRIVVPSLFLFLLLLTHSAIASPTLTSLKMYNEPEFQEEQTRFFPSDTMYLVADFSGLQPGDYALSVEWILPSGKLARNDQHDFTLTTPAAGYRVQFWLELRANGPMSQMFSGKEYKSSVYGEWKARLHLNGKTLGNTLFIVTDEPM